jgi:tetratricopeptide (TPR) repeat protein
MAKKKKTGTSAPQTVSEAKEERTNTGSESAGFKGFFSDRTNVYIILALAAGVLLVYGQTLWFNFISIDDGGYVFENTVVTQGLSWDSIKWAFTTYSQANYHPLTWISYLLDSTIYGVSPGTYHLTNVLLHAINSALLFVAVKYLTGSTWRSAMVAALFAFHPTHVESVAWVAERKDVLSTFFWILTTYFYARYSRLQDDPGLSDSPEKKKQRRNFYLLAVVAMAFGILAKPMVVTLPFTLLLLDYWPLKRLEAFTFKKIQGLVIEKLPLFALSAVSSVVTVIAQKQGGAVVSLEALPFQLRAMSALVAYAKYVVMMFYPANLGLTYLFELTIPAWQIIASVILLIAVTLYCVLRIRDKKYLFVGWFWFVGTLIPVIGLVQVGTQALADRYTYIPYIGLAIMLVWLAADLLQKLDRRIVAAAACVIVVLCAGLTFRQTGFWKNSESLFVHTIAVTQKNAFIEQNLCLFYMNQNRLEEAEAQCRKAIEDKPAYYTPYKLMGVISFKRGSVDDAANYFAQALKLRPDDFGSYTDFTIAQISQGKDLDRAAEMVDKMATALPINDDTVIRQVLLQNYNLLGWGYSQKNDYEKAALYFGKALEINGADSDLRSNYGFLLYRSGKEQEGIAQVEESIRQNPNKAEPQNMLGTILAAQGKNEEAIKHFEKALEIDPNFTPAQNNLKKVKSRK